MTIEIGIVLFILLAAIILFVSEKLSVDLVALLALAALLMTGILSAEEGFRGFSDDATITIGAMFIISSGLFKTGVVSYIGRIVVLLFRKNFWMAIIFTMIFVGIISAFINNTPVVAIFLPILLQVSRETDISASKLLMPLSFASIFGGVCTLIGTSTNIVVSSIAAQYGQAPLGMFEFTSLGALFFIAGIIYMIFIGIPLIPNRRGGSDLTDSFGLGDYLTVITIGKDSDAAGKKIEESSFNIIDIIEIIRQDKKVFLPSSNFVLKEGDTLRIKASVEKIRELKEKKGITIQTGVDWSDADLAGEDKILVEAIISPNAVLVGKTLKQINFGTRFKATALAIRHRGRVMYENVSNTKLLAGDALLIELDKQNLDRLKENEMFLIISESQTPTFIKSKIFFAVAITAGVVIVTALGIVPIVVSSVIGSLLLILTKCINLEQAYKSIDWSIIMLLAGSLSLGLALEKTGAADLISGNIIDLVGDFGPIAVLAAFYLITLVLTEAMSNNATAALVTPIAIVTANSLGVDPRPFLITIAFAASLAFMTPIGYQTHLLIYNPGRYRYVDFLKVGTPLNILFWIMAVIFIPIFFPF
jgi:di/tricarboxylate transporter